MPDNAPIGTDQFSTMFFAMADAMNEKRDELCALDGVIGDADHGISMALGFDAVRKALSEADPQPENPAALFNSAAKSFLNAVGASTGPLYATAFMRAAAAVKGRDQVSASEFVGMIEAMAGGIADRGKAELGDKTMLDVWRPAAVAIRNAWSQTGDLRQALQAGGKAADQNAEATSAMIARVGRASRLGERSVGHVDPGAASAAILINVMINSLVPRI